ARGADVSPRGCFKAPRSRHSAFGRSEGPLPSGVRRRSTPSALRLQRSAPHHARTRVWSAGTEHDDVTSRIVVEARPTVAGRLPVYVTRHSLARLPSHSARSHGASMTRRSVRQLCLLVLLVLPRTTAIAQGGRFDLKKTKTVLTGLIERTLADHGIPSMSIALVRGDSIVWKAAFGYSNMRMHTPATTETLYSTG